MQGREARPVKALMGLTSLVRSSARRQETYHEGLHPGPDGDADRAKRTLPDAALAISDEEITPQQLDDLPNTPTTRYLRDLLVVAAVLPPRDERLEALPRWADALLAQAPLPQRQLVPPSLIGIRSNASAGSTGTARYAPAHSTQHTAPDALATAPGPGTARLARRTWHRSRGTHAARTRDVAGGRGCRTS